MIHLEPHMFGVYCSSFYKDDVVMYKYVFTCLNTPSGQFSNLCARVGMQVSALYVSSQKKKASFQRPVYEQRSEA